MTNSNNERHLRLALLCVALPLLLTLLAHALAYADPIFITPEGILIASILWKGVSFNHSAKDASHSTIKTLIALAVSNLGIGLTYILAVVLTRRPYENASSILYPLMVCATAALTNLWLLTRDPRARWALIPSLGSLLVPIGGLVAVLYGYQEIPCLLPLLPKVLWPFVAWPLVFNAVIQLMALWPILKSQPSNRAYIALATACGLLAALTVVELYAEVLRRLCG